MKTRDYEIRRRRARRNKTRQLKARITAAADARLKTRLTEKLKKVNPYLTDVK